MGTGSSSVREATAIPEMGGKAMSRSRDAAVLVTSLVMHSQSQAATNDFQMQLILLPALHGGARFVDIDKHGRADLIVLEPLENRLVIYRQSSSGFPTN